MVNAMEGRCSDHPLQGAKAAYESVVDPELEHIIKASVDKHRGQGDAQQCQGLIEAEVGKFLENWQTSTY